MFSNYEDDDNVAYSIMNKEIKNNNISHAYLIDVNNNTKAFEFALNFAKAIFCRNVNTSQKEKICMDIDNNNYSELKIIKPDGLNIKKQQIIELQQEFSRLSINNNYKIYIICECDKMKQEAANAMLKFLEEPNDNIVAILLTNNINSVLPTIVSRCQNIKLENNISSVDNLEFDDIEKEIFKFVVDLENCGLNIFLDKKNAFLNNGILKDRSLFLKCYDLLIDIYYDALNFSCGIEDNNFPDFYVETLKTINSKNSLLILLKKIKFMVISKDKIKCNLNLNVFYDNFIINMIKIQEEVL